MLFRNTLANTSPTVLGYVFSFLLAPLMLSRFGLAGYGVWAVTGAVASYAWLMDLGLRRALSRFIALYDASGDERAIKECMGLGLIVMTLVGLVVGLAAYVSAPLFVATLGVLNVDDMRIVVLCAGAIAMCYGFMSVLASVSTGLRRMVPPNVAGVIGMVLNFGFSVASLLISGSLVNYALANAAAGLLSIIPSVGAVFYVWRGFPAAVPSWPRAREIFSFSVKSQVHWLSSLVNQQTDKIIIAVLVDVRAAAVFDIGARVAGATKAVALLSISAMVPTATAEFAKRGREIIPDWYRRYTRIVVALTLPLFVLACLCAPFLLVAWLGEIPGEGVLVILFLTLAYMINATNEVGMTTSTADGRPGFVALNSTIIAGLNVVFTVALAPWLGFEGVLFGTFLAITVGSALFVVRFHRRYSIPLVDYLRAVGTPALLAGGLALPFALLWLTGDALLGSRATAAATVLSIVGLYGAAYWVAASRLGLLPRKLTLRFARPRERQATS